MIREKRVGAPATRYDKVYAEKEFGFTTQEAQYLQDWHRAATDLQSNTLSMLEVMTRKALAYIESGKPGSMENVKVITCLADANTRMVKMIKEAELEERKLQMKREAMQGTKLDPAEMGPRELEAFARVLIEALGADKVRALLP